MRALFLALLCLLGASAAAQTIEPFVADTGSSGGNTGTLTIANISSPQSIGAGFNVSGTYGGATTPTGIDWQADCSGSWTALSSPTISANSWSSTASDVVFNSGGNHSVCVREQTATNINASSNTFAVHGTLTATNPGGLITSAGYTQAGTYSGSGYTPAAIDYSFDSTACGSAASSPTVSGGNISFTNTAPGSGGSHTITLCDHADHTIFGTSTSFTVNTGTIAINTPSTQAAGVAFDSFGGTWTGSPTPTNVDVAFSTSAACPGTGTFSTLGGSFTAGSPWSSTGTQTISSAGNYYACARMTNSTGIVSSPAGPFTVTGYTGPLDIVGTATACWSFAACSATIASSATANVVQISRTSDSHHCQVKIASTGQLATTVTGCGVGGDNGTAVSTWCNATTCYAGPGSTNPGMYDQTANAFDQAAFNGIGITLTASCFSTFYCFTFGTSNDYLTSNGTTQNTLLSSTFTIIAAVYPTATVNGTAYAIVGSSSGSGVEFRLTGQAGNATAKLELVKQGISSVALSTCTVSVNAWHSVAVTYDGSGNYAFYVDGATCGSGTNLQTFTLTGNLYLSTDLSTGEHFIGNIRTVVTYASVLSAANVEAIENLMP